MWFVGTAAREREIALQYFAEHVGIRRTLTMRVVLNDIPLRHIRAPKIRCAFVAQSILDSTTDNMEVGKLPSAITDGVHDARSWAVCLAIADFCGFRMPFVKV